MAILAIVEECRLRGELPAATLRPLCRLTEDLRRWERPLTPDESREAFPNNGRVSWIQPDTKAIQGTVWQTSLVHQPTYDEYPKNPRRDRWMVEKGTAVLADEVIDTSSLGGEVLGRDHLVSIGVGLPMEPLGPLLVRVGEHLWVRLPFRRHPTHGGFWVLDPAGLDEPLRFVEWSAGDTLVEIEVGGIKRCFVVAGTKPVGPVRMRDWAPDATVLKRVLSKLRKWDGSLAEELTLSERAVDRIVEKLTSQGPTIGNVEMERARLQRAKDFLERVSGYADVAAAARQVIDHGPIADEIEQQKEEILRTQLQDAKTRAELAMESEKKRIGELRREVETLEARIRGLREHHDRVVEKLDGEMSRKLEEILGKPEAFLADVAVLEAARRVVRRGREASVPEPLLEARRVRQAPRSGTGTVRLEEFCETYQQALLARDTPRAISRPVLGCLLAGCVPVLHGARARDSLEAFARVCTVDEIAWVDVSPQCTCPADLLRSGLESVIEAEEDEIVRLVVLEGINRAPAESYLIPVLDAYANAWRAGPGKCLRWPAHGTPSRDRAVRWPKALLLGATLVEGVTTLGVPQQVWARAGLYLSDELVVGPELDVVAGRIHPTRRPENVPPPRAVTVSTWERWREAVGTIDLRSCTARWSSFEEELDLDRGVRDAFLSLYSASRATGATDGEALSDAIVHLLLPVLASRGAGPPGCLVGLTSAYEDAGRALERASGLLRP